MIWRLKLGYLGRMLAKVLFIIWNQRGLVLCCRYLFVVTLKPLLITYLIENTRSTIYLSNDHLTLLCLEGMIIRRVGLVIRTFLFAIWVICFKKKNSFSHFSFDHGMDGIVLATFLIKNCPKFFFSTFFLDFFFLFSSAVTFLKKINYCRHFPLNHEMDELLRYTVKWYEWIEF